MTARTDAVRTPGASPAESVVRGMGVAAIAGIIAGALVGGVGGRLAMRIAGAMTDPSLNGIAVTENGNILGRITAEGTIGLIVFVGILPGIAGGLMYLAARPWLAPLGRWRGFVYGLALLAAVAPGIALNPRNVDFRRFGSPQVDVLMFAALFPLFGVLLAPLADRIDRAARDIANETLRVLTWLAAVLPALLVVLLLVSIGPFLSGQSSDADPLAFVLLYWLVAVVALRWYLSRGRRVESAADLSPRERILTYALLLAPAALGLPSTVQAIWTIARP